MLGGKRETMYVCQYQNIFILDTHFTSHTPRLVAHAYFTNFTLFLSSVYLYTNFLELWPLGIADFHIPQSHQECHLPVTQAVSTPDKCYNIWLLTHTYLKT